MSNSRRENADGETYWIFTLHFISCLQAIVLENFKRNRMWIWSLQKKQFELNYFQKPARISKATWTWKNVILENIHILLCLNKWWKKYLRHDRNQRSLTVSPICISRQ
jgi:hypothetical protein